MLLKMNLWADFENNQPAPVSNARPRRLTEQVIQSFMRDWLLQDYIPAYCRMLAASRIFRRCYLVDALGNEQNVNILRPVDTLHRQLSQEQRPIALYALLLAAGTSKRRNAKNGKVLAVPKLPANLLNEGGVIRASWLEVAPLLLAEIAQAPAICLLNPCGQRLFSYNDLLPLYQRTLPTELLLWVSHRQLEGHFLHALQAPDHAAALTALLRTDRWKTLSPAQQDLPQSISTLVDLLVASMQRHFQLPVQPLQFPLLVRSAVVEVAPYSLLFATRRQDSLLSMNNAVCLYRRRVYEQSHQGLLAEEWFQQQQQGQEARALQELSTYLLQHGRAQRIRRWPDLRQYAVLSHFGQFTTNDYDALIMQLLANNEVRCEWKRKLGDSENAEVEGEPGNAVGNVASIVIPGNDDSLLWR